MHERQHTPYSTTLIALGLFLVLFFPGAISADIVTRIKGIAAAFFTESVSTDTLVSRYSLAQTSPYEKIRVLIVPGHDNEHWGTEYRGIREADLNLALARHLRSFLEKNTALEVTLTRDENGDNPAIATYINTQEEAIRQFILNQKLITNDLVQQELIDVRRGIEHVAVGDDIAVPLYGINKWANENNIDIVIHIHMNDTPTRRYDAPGEYTGFSMYVPDSQFSNARASRDLAEAIKKKLNGVFSLSDHPQEEGGIVPDQELIAVGAYNTLDPAVILMEYGYIYEPQFVSPDTRDLLFKEAALQTYNGLLTYLSGHDSVYADTVLTPHAWNRELREGIRTDADVLRMQSALTAEGVYPPPAKTTQECPLTGTFLSCTKEAVILFQKKYDIEPAVGFVGPLTRAKLNSLY